MLGVTKKDSLVFHKESFFLIFAKIRKYYEQESTMGHDAADECL